jgi:hypothetical protein
MTDHLSRARELDDPYPINVCPGCGQDITGWEEFEAHYPPGVEPIRVHEAGYLEHRHTPMPFAILSTNFKGPDRCEWTGDYLAARAHRRRMISGDGVVVEDGAHEAQHPNAQVPHDVGEH